MQNAHEIQMSLTRNFNGKQTSGGRPPLKKAKKKKKKPSEKRFSISTPCFLAAMNMFYWLHPKIWFTAN
jgi:hypothetical protein